MPTLLQRLARFAPYFRSGRHGIAVAFGASLVMALTEPVLPALMKPLLDNGFGQTDIPLWLVPVVIIGLFVRARRGQLRRPVRAGVDRQPGRAEPARRDVRRGCWARSRSCSRGTRPAS